MPANDKWEKESIRTAAQHIGLTICPPNQVISILADLCHINLRRQKTQTVSSIVHDKPEFTSRRTLMKRT